MDGLPEHGRVRRLHGTHGLIDKIDFLFEEVSPAIDERADVLAELDRGKDLRLGSRKHLVSRLFIADDGRSQVNRADEVDRGAEVLCEDFGVARDLEACVERAIHGLVVS